MSYKRDLRVSRGHNEGRADWLFAKKLIHDSLLDPLHQFLPEESDYGCIDARRHQPESIPCRHKAIVRSQLLKPALDHTDIEQIPEPSSKSRTHLRIRMYKPQATQHRKSP